tara:strand:+ start:59 stop:490 length:432 start_codon:yes stop_codon:yes gene_type:complete
MNFKRFFSLNFLAKLLLSAIFVNAIPSKISDFSRWVEIISNKGFPEPLSNLLLVAVIGVLISGSILLIFSNKTKLACSLLLLFLIPTTIIFHLRPFELMEFTRNLSLIGGLLIAIDKTKVISTNQNSKQESREIEYSDLNEDN